MIKAINQYFTDIYFHLHPTQNEAISHQTVRILQTVQKRRHVMIRDIADQLQISHNTASEHVKKIVESGWLQKVRGEEDQRKVYLQLTEKGLQLLRKHSELDEVKLGQVLNQLSKQDQEKVVEAFRLLSEVVK